MSKVQAQRKNMFSTELGNMGVQVETRTEFDVEDIIRLRAVAQGRQVQFVNLGKGVDKNQPKGTRTIPSIYTDNDEELLS